MSGADGDATPWPTLSALVAYAIFFGASPDVITRLIDRKPGETAEVADPEAATSGAAGGG